MIVNIKPERRDGAVDEPATQCGPAAKWAAVLVNDTLIPMPSRHIRAPVLRHQSSISATHALSRGLLRPAGQGRLAGGCVKNALSVS
jgi:hypothetical protein